MTYLHKLTILLALILLSLPLAACGERDSESVDENHMAHTANHNTGTVETATEAVEHGNLRLETIWSRPSLAAGNGATYLTITNEGQDEDRLLNIQTSVAEVAEIHQSKSENNVMTMEMLPDGLPLPAGKQVALEPGGYHIMLVNLQQDLTAGDSYTLTLHLESAGEVDVQVEVIQQ
ncbi:MAG: copper chaperone PCu(A)C [Chloroflexota bacterium]